MTEKPRPKSFVPKGDLETWGALNQEVPRTVDFTNFETVDGVAMFDLLDADFHVPEGFVVDSRGRAGMPLVRETKAIETPKTRFRKIAGSDTDRWVSYSVVHELSPVPARVKVLLDLEGEDEFDFGDRRVFMASQYQASIYCEARLDKRKLRLYIFASKDPSKQIVSRITASKIWSFGDAKWNLKDITKKMVDSKDMIHAWVSTLDVNVKRASIYGTKVDASSTMKSAHFTSVDLMYNFEGQERMLHVSEERRVRTMDRSLTHDQLIELAEELERLL